MKPFLLRHSLSLSVVLGIVVLSLMPVPELPRLEDVPLADKWMHMAMYGCFATVVWAELCRFNRTVSYAAATLAAFVFPVLLGGAMELAQAHLTTCRSGEWLDFVANSVGAGIALPFGIAFLWLSKRRG